MLPRLKLPPSPVALAPDRGGVHPARPHRARSLEDARRRRPRHRARHVRPPASCSCRASPARRGCSTRRSITGSPPRSAPRCASLHRVPRRGAPRERRAGRGGVLFRLARRARLGAEDEKRPSTAAAAMLLVLGAVGLMVHAHEALPELAGLAALCGALAALPHAPRRPVARRDSPSAPRSASRALASGWIAPLALAIAVIAARFACPAWRVAAGLAFPAARAAAGDPDRGELAVACSRSARPRRSREWRALTLPVYLRPIARPALLPRHRQLVYLAGVADRAVTAWYLRRAVARAAPVRARRGGAGDARRLLALGARPRTST
mgnify:CR=1 FL=1